MAFAGGLAAEVAAVGPANTRKLSARALLAIEAALLVAVFAGLMHFGLCYMGDSKYSILVSENLLYDHTFVVDPESVRVEAPFALGTSPKSPALRKPFPYQMEMVNGQLFYFYPVGSSVISIPLVALMNLAGYSAHNPIGRYNEDGDRQIQKTIAALLMAILAVVFFRTALLLLPLSWSLVMAIGAAFGTQVWSSASRALWSHTWMILLFGIAIYMILSEEEDQAQGHPIILATVLSWAYFVRPTSAIPIAAITLYILVFKPKAFIALAGTGATWLAAFLVFSWKTFHRLLPTYYLFHLNLSPGHSFEAIFGDLISPSRGLFIYTPGAAFGLFLVCYYWGKLSHRSLALLSLLTAALQLLVIATDPNWWGGHCYGARLTTDILPWLFLLTALGCRALRDEPHAALKHYAIAFGLMTIVVGALMNGRGAMSPAANDWVNGPPDVDDQPGRVWDWSYPQFLAGLGCSHGR